MAHLTSLGFPGHSQGIPKHGVPAQASRGGGHRDLRRQSETHGGMLQLIASGSTFYHIGKYREYMGNIIWEYDFGI